ncbi:response regulator transcription factor [Roseibium aggregatum]|jgi:FixJ family two-component response regulator|uniref:Two component transcriptional regulator, LuxR family protein n=1 Tax=Roseibium aggregatum (strain ATCC 25650 / DSM 13394 / JCM 20685 / NBRC 16684 / NCIMB 2208 / IAM 12614 / B1) TaxID=384765 RepID=A0NRC8_ROSAI|nr:two component transcriptional regulator, LuxR family protein [Roseibium aggregatum IAM 12614]
MDMKADAEAIYIVDDDPAVRDALSVLFNMEGYVVETFSDGDTFIQSASKAVPACVMLDVHMPGRSGIEILKALNAENYPAPIFIISGQGDIPMAVEAIRNGAFDFVEKPFSAETVLERVKESIAITRQRQDKVVPASFQGADLLTRRELEVLKEITDGASNKEAGRTLGISPRTVEVHRARIMEKLGARNAADLVRIVLGHPSAG